MTSLFKVIYCVALLVVPISSVAQISDNYSDLIDDIRPSVVSVQVFDSRGNLQKQGTGFCVGNGLFITNYHVVDGAGRITIRTSGNRDFVVRIESEQPTSDLVLLRTENEIGTKPLRFLGVSPR